MGAPLGHPPYNVNGEGGVKPKYDEEFYNKEADELLEWSTLYSSFRLYGFTNTKDYCVDDLQYFASRSDRFSRALRKAKERLALRREDGASDGVLPIPIHNKTAHIYDHELVSADDIQEDKRAARDARIKAASISDNNINITFNDPTIRNSSQIQVPSVPG